MNYSEKLKDQRWHDLRTAFIASRRDSNLGSQCDDCGEDTNATLHVHHRLYRRGAEPWEYEFEELRLICATCHTRIHDTEERLRVFVRAVPPHVCYEINQLLDELGELKSDALLKLALARARREAINLQHQGE